MTQETLFELMAPPDQYVAPLDFTVATSRYQAADAIKASGLAPVRITRGRPRWRLAYQLAGEVRVLAPTRAEFRLTGDEFKRAYVERLDQVGAAHIRGLLAEISRANGGRGVIALCFEDVHAGQDCHRRAFAEWFEWCTGRAVPELPADGRLA